MGYRRFICIRELICGGVIYKPKIFLFFMFVALKWLKTSIETKVGRSKPSPVLTSGFNRLKPPRSICQKVVNTGQYESDWSIENSKGRFCGELRSLYTFYVLSIEKIQTNTVSSLPRALFMVKFPSQDLRHYFFLHHQRQNRITIQGLLLNFETISFNSL